MLGPGSPGLTLCETSGRLIREAGAAALEGRRTHRRRGLEPAPVEGPLEPRRCRRQGLIYILQHPQHIGPDRKLRFALTFTISNILSKTGKKKRTRFQVNAIHRSQVWGVGVWGVSVLFSFLFNKMGL